MASASLRGRVGYLSLVVAVVFMSAQVSSQSASFFVKKSIANPGFPCGEPYGRNGEPPSHPTAEPIYYHYWEVLTQTPAGEEIFCGASPISDHFLITAAHCIQQIDKRLYVRLEDIELHYGESNFGPVQYEIESIFIHPDYRADSLVRYNDMALLKTKEKIQFDDVVFPYCISDNPSVPGTIVTISGFDLDYIANPTDEIVEANVTIIDTKQCEDYYLSEGLEEDLTDRYPNLLQGTDIICAIDDVSYACKGLSGGPMLMEKNGKRYVEGIMSGAPNCDSSFSGFVPGLYVSPARHLDFISETVLGPPPPAVF